MILILVMATLGYFLPNWHLNGKIKKLKSENRSGFPDVMDLMIVAAEAGLTMEASIERIARDVRVCQIYEGTSDIQKLIIGRALAQ